ncbi:MAG: cell division protein ZapE [Magnetococcales bacterium]|nr:cell division protein ZapE [Magnetococcales bacterium]NGZ04759.1 cell division protein ZapE [Magnetococcales bacterium]
MTGYARALFPWELQPTDHGEERSCDRPSRYWLRAVENGLIQRDPVQESILPLLDQVAAAVRQPVRRVLWRGVEVWRGESGELPDVRGVYLHGDVGRGKSLLMQWLFDSIPIAEKRRVHFHPFMEEIHHRLHQAKPPGGVDLVLYVASQIAAEARLLCFDEFYITTIADGVLLGRLLSALHHCGVTLCATSNWAPDHLFQDGYNRASVLPFIERLKSRIQVCELGHGVDWRRRIPGPLHGLTPTPEESFSRLTGHAPKPTSITLRHTDVPVRGMENGVFWFGFEALCNTMLGRAEYMKLCHQAKIVIISGVPGLTADDADAAMRFVVLVDLLYEHRIPLRVHGLVALDEACPDGPAAFAWRRSVSRVHELSRLGDHPEA